MPDQLTYTMKIPVRDYEVDSQGIVNNANYLHYMEITRHQFCIAAGAPFSMLQKEGLDPVVRRIEIDYISSLTMDDVMESSLTMHREGPRFIFHQTIRNAATGARVVDAVVTVVCLENKRLSKGDRLASYFHL